jgi:hypothetical protein
MTAKAYVSGWTLFLVSQYFLDMPKVMEHFRRTFISALKFAALADIERLRATCASNCIVIFLHCETRLSNEATILAGGMARWRKFITVGDVRWTSRCWKSMSGKKYITALSGELARSAGALPEIYWVRRDQSSSYCAS